MSISSHIYKSSLGQIDAYAIHIDSFKNVWNSTLSCTFSLPFLTVHMKKKKNLWDLIVPPSHFALVLVLHLKIANSYLFSFISQLHFAPVRLFSFKPSLMSFPKCLILTSFWSELCYSFNWIEPPDGSDKTNLFWIQNLMLDWVG